MIPYPPADNVCFPTLFRRSFLENVDTGTVGGASDIYQVWPHNDDDINFDFEDIVNAVDYGDYGFGGNEVEH